MQVPFFTLKFQHEQIKSEVFRKIEELYDRTEFVYGKTGKEFEENFALFNEMAFACAIDNGTTGVELCLRAAGIKQGDEVITVSNTFIATVAAIHFTGAKPVFVEADANTWNMDPAKIEEKIIPATKAILPVHLYGQPANMIEINKIAEKYNLIVIGDSAQSVGSKIFYNEEWKSTSRFADISSFSFYPGKNLGACGEAGMIVTNNSNYAKFINMFRDHGSEEKYIHDFPGKNNRIDAFQSAILNIKLKHLDLWNAQRRQVAKWYFDELGSIEEIQLPAVPDNVLPVHHLFVILVKNREDFQKYLAEKGVGTALHYKLPIHLQKAFHHLNYKKGDLPITESIVERNISLPMFPELTCEQVKYIAKTIKEYFCKN
ncbi:MAG: DegT/DnrJ/EryC1/StrS family aminotransferase [Bacteroidia bacterium]|nr:DegT/DnrJ/EryC1/StrS family aminotransferase [Bacteroidia bacterium]